jgi:hypothetical protein
MTSINQHATNARQVQLEWRREEEKYLAVVFDNIYTEAECKAMIGRSEEAGYEPALVNIGSGRQQLITDIRNNDRCIIDDPGLAKDIWQRVGCAVDAMSPDLAADMNLAKLFFLDLRRLTGSTWTAVGLNERLRFLRYKPGAYFRPHQDGCYSRRSEAGLERRGETSFVTLQLYLNDSDGGATKFLCNYHDKECDKVEVQPRAGSVLVFQHNLLHEGAPVDSGLKYVIRTDVMFTDKGDGHEYSRRPIVTMPL